MENLWLEPRLLSAILQACAISEGADDVVAQITSEAVEKELASHNSEKEKGSAIIDKIAGRFQLHPGKKELAELAVRFLPDLARDAAAVLKEAVRAALSLAD